LEICDRIVSWTFSDGIEYCRYSQRTNRRCRDFLLCRKCSRLARNKPERKRSVYPSLAVVAQLVEHVLGKDEVTGSIPVNGSISGWIVKRSNTADCKSVGSAFEGSNPSPPTMMGISLKDVSVGSTVTRCLRYFERFAFSCLRGSLVIAHSRKRDARNSLRRLSSAGRATVL
jgi:hypothetical protein